MLAGRMKDIAHQRGRRLAGGAVSTAVGLGLLTALWPGATLAGGALPNLADLVRQHEAMQSEIASGHLEYRVVRECSQAARTAHLAGWRSLARDRLEAVTNSELPPGSSVDSREMNVALARGFAERAEQYAMADFLKNNATYEAQATFDTHKAASVLRLSDERDLEALVEQYHLDAGPACRLAALQLEVCTDGMYLRYDSGSDLALLNDNSQLPLVPSVHALLGSQAGFLDRSALASGAWAVSADEDGMLRLEETRGDLHTVVMLDPKLGCRLKESTTGRGDTIASRTVWEYRLWGEALFPSRYESVTYAKDGTVYDRLVHEFTRVELNVPIDDEEFEFELPEDAGVMDPHSGKTLKAVGSLDPPLYGYLTLRDLSDILLDHRANAEVEPLAPAGLP